MLTSYFSRLKNSRNCRCSPHRTHAFVEEDEAVWDCGGQNDSSTARGTHGQRQARSSGARADLFGDFKNAMQLEQFVAGLTRFGAPKRFIKQKLDEYTGMGMIAPGYAPDILVTERSERHNEFGVPLLTIEIISQHSRENDLHFKPYFYETIGVREYFIAEALEDHGTLLKAYRLVENRYQPLTLSDEQYYSETLGIFLPRVWPT